MKNLEYRGHKSTTFQLVLLCFLTGTGLILGGYLTGSEWVTGVLGLVSGYVLKDAAANAAEAWRDKTTPPNPS